MELTTLTSQRSAAPSGRAGILMWFGLISLALPPEKQGR